MPNEMMIGNENRMTATGEDDETPVDDVISNRLLTVGKCQMWCGHWIGNFTASTKNVHNVSYHIFIKIQNNMYFLKHDTIYKAKWS